MSASEEKPLYQQIINWVRHEIMEGRISPGDRLPSIHEMTINWHCTPGTVQRAYAELAQQGIVNSRPGQGTHVKMTNLPVDEMKMQRSVLVHRAEAFLLDAISAGYKPDEIDMAFRFALDRWRVVPAEQSNVNENILRFAGSHDPALGWLASRFPVIFPPFHLQLGYTGSLGGLMALAQGKADFTGIHLWDPQTESYNIPYVKRLLPGQKVALVLFAYRRLGLILPPGNPNDVQGLSDLKKSGSVFINRQSGSGTRVWLDAALEKMDIDPRQIIGYQDEVATHSAVATAIAEGRANVGIGLETAAHSLGLGYIHLLQEPYELVIPEANFNNPSLNIMVNWLATPEAHHEIEAIGGYVTTETGRITWVS